MITSMVAQQEGEWFTDGTVDEWLAVHTASSAWGGGQGHMDLTPAQVAMVRALATEPPPGRFWLVQVSGYLHRLQVIGLYDGWVYWRKRIVLGTDGPIPVTHHHEAYNLEAAMLGEPDDGSRFPFNHWRRIPGTEVTP